MKLRIVIACLVLVSLLPLGPFASAQEAEFTPYLVKDMNTQASSGGEFYGFIEAGEFSYLFNDGRGKQVGLWKTDGSLEGTIFLKVLSPSWPMDEMDHQPAGAILDGMLFFGGCVEHATLGRHCELWKTDGTEEGTVLAADLAPGDASSNPGNFVAMGDRLFFVTNHGLWRLDSVNDDPILVISQDYEAGDYRIESPLFVLGNLLYFSAKDPVHGTELWVSDGTPSGTTVLMDIYPGSEGSYATPLLAQDGMLYFAANSGYSGFEIWVFKQSLGSLRIISDVNAYSVLSLSMVTKLGDLVFFRVYEPYTTWKIYVSDGSVSRPLFARNPDAAPLDPQLVGSIASLSGERLLFFGSDENDVYHLWSTDGTEANNALIYGEATLPIPGSGSREPYRMLPEAEIFEGQLFFSSNHPTAGVDLLKSDGTTEGTALLLDIRSGILGSRPKFLGRCGAWLCFTANDGVNGRELWRTGGNAENTILIGDLSLEAPGSTPNSLVGIEEWVYFVADAGEGPALWRSDGTDLHTENIWVNPTNREREPSDLTVVGDRLYFVTDELSSGSELWMHEVITGDTHLVSDITPGIKGSYLRQLTAVGDLLFFVVEVEDFSRQLWRTDGTPAGTFMLTDASPGSRYSGQVVLVEYNDKVVYYAPSSSGYTYDLWISDGTLDGTKSLMSFDYEPENFAKGNGLLFFEIHSYGDDTYFVWQTDGSTKGTKPIARPGCINPDAGFIDSATVGNRTLWRSFSIDYNSIVILGTSGDTMECLLSYPIEGEYPATIGDIYDFHGKGIFQIIKFDQNAMVYRLLTLVTDGTQEGTHVIPGDPRLVRELVTAGPFLIMNALAPEKGYELHLWDGSESASRLIDDINPGLESSYPVNFITWNGKVFFTADDGLNGRELWALDLGLKQVWLPVIGQRSSFSN